MRVEETRVRGVIAAIGVLCVMLWGCDDPEPPKTTPKKDMMVDMSDMSSDLSLDMPADMPGDVPPDVAGDMLDMEMTATSWPVLGRRCNVDGLSEQDKVRFGDGVSIQHSVGDFLVELKSDRQIEVYHKFARGRALYSTPRNQPLLKVSQTDLKVEEHQGSFDIEENLGRGCEQAVIETALLKNGTMVLQGRFDDPGSVCAKAKFEVQFCEAEFGHLGFEVTTNDAALGFVALPMASDRDERIYGMGEQFPHDDLNLKGRVIPSLSQEGGIGRGHSPITGAVNVASKGSGGSEASTYYAAPHFLTSKHRSMFLENTEYAVFDFEKDDVTWVRLFHPTMRGRLLYGQSPLELIERFTSYAGRMPPIPDWVNEGAIVALARDLDESERLIMRMKQNGVQIAGVWNQTWSGTSTTFVGEQVLWNWIQNPNRHPDWDGFVQRMNTQGIRTLCYVNSMFRDVPEDAGQLRRNLYQEGEMAGYFVKDTTGKTYKLKITAFEVGLLDLTNPMAVDWMKKVIKEEMIQRAGCSGWMADFAEALPFDAVMSDGTPASTYHNEYPVAWAKLNREAVEEAGKLGEVLVFHRSGFTRSPQHALMFWQGDQLTTWDKYDGLVSAMRGLINGGLSGISLNHSDIGGYTSLSRFNLGYKRESEQLKRWAEMNAFTAVFRTHEGNQPMENAQVYTDDEAMQHFARMSKVYKALAFYRKTLFAEARDKGWPVVRHMMLHYPDDPKAHENNDQFLLGSQILVAPIKNKCFVAPCRYNKKVYLPKGQWVHLWTGQVYGKTDRSEEITVQAPIGQPAVFYPSGSMVGATFVQNLRTLGINVP